MDPVASLSSLERTLLRVSKEHGAKPFIAVVTAISVGLSVALTMPIMLLIDSTPAQLWMGLGMSIGVPAVVAPAAAAMLGRLLLAIDDASRELHHLARVDSLTDVLNRRAFADEAGRVSELVGDRRLLVAMIDVDDFKKVNDTHGHAVGDQVLVALAARLRDASRDHGVVGRFGGDEFVVVQAVEAATVETAEALLHAACDLDEVLPGVKASIGITVSTSGASLEGALQTADALLYARKRAARAARAARADAPEAQPDRTGQPVGASPK